MNSNDLLKRLMGGGLTGPNASAKGSDLLNKLLNSGAAGGVLGGALSGSLTSLLTGKKGKKLAKSALKVGGIAAIGGLAYAAYRKYQQQAEQPATAQNQPSAPSAPLLSEAPLSESGFLPPSGDTAGRDALGLALIRAMIAAAKADGHIDQKEHRRIFDQVKRLHLAAEDQAFLLEELGKPLDIDAVVKLGVTSEVAAELYTASVLAVDVDTPAEQAYLQMLAARLRLEPALVEQIHATVESAASEAGAAVG